MQKLFRYMTDEQIISLLNGGTQRYKAPHANRPTPPKLHHSRNSNTQKADAARWNGGRLNRASYHLPYDMPTEREDKYLHSYARRFGEYRSDMQTA